MDATPGRCPTCGSDVMPGDMSCRSCGASVADNLAQAAPIGPSAPPAPPAPPSKVPGPSAGRNEATSGGARRWVRNHKAIVGCLVGLVAWFVLSGGWPDSPLGYIGVVAFSASVAGLLALASRAAWRRRSHPGRKVVFAAIGVGAGLLAGLFVLVGLASLASVFNPPTPGSTADGGALATASPATRVIPTTAPSPESSPSGTAIAGSSSSANTLSPSTVPEVTPSPTPASAAFTVVEPATGSTVATADIVVRGTGPPGARVVHDILLQRDDDAIIDASGGWAMPITLREGANVLTFRLGEDETTNIVAHVTYERATAPGPAATPAPTIDPDSIAALPVLPGLEAADLKLNLEDKGYDCTGPEPYGDGVSYTCQVDRTDRLIRVDWFGLKPSDVRSIEGSVVWYGQGSAEQLFDAHLGYLATTPYDGARPKAARTWVETVTKGRKTFGPALFTVGSSANGRSRTLLIEGR